MDKILEGDLSHFEVPDLLSLLRAGRRTGVLALERRDQESKLYFRAGDPCSRPPPARTCGWAT